MTARRVRVLPDALANRIAAGEVVERPASVVKELVENAVDAGASRVRVLLEGAGKSLVAVEDDGEGMSREDALLALERHATSKIALAEDLDRISTLGFRGEALPSIASVCRLRLLTRTDDAGEGTEIRVEGGEVVAVDAAGAPRGTTVQAADLFFNVPARRKFLKGDATELRVAVDLVTQLALVHPAVGFEMRSGSRNLIAVPPQQPLEERVADLVGTEAAGGLHVVRSGGDDRDLTFAFAAPHEGRGHRRGVRLFVNGRPVQDRLLVRAMLEGYRGLLETGRYPVALLWLRVPPDEVDVNVHPAKREVRFRDEGRVFKWVAGSVAEALARGPWAFTDRAPMAAAPEAAIGSRGRAPGDPPSDTRPAAVDRVSEALGEYASKLSEGPVATPGVSRPAASRPVPPLLRSWPGPLAADQDAEDDAGRFGAFRYVGAFDATYLLFEDGASRELVVMDQHAAHERILYESLLAAGEGGSRALQPLLFPVTLECSPREMAIFQERRADLEALGFRVEPFGPTAVAVEAAPPGLSPAAAEGAVRELLGGDGESDGAQDAAAHRVGLARRAACAAAVKARAALVPSEVQALLRRLEGLRNPTHCPHGRPLFVRLSRQAVAAMFHRD